MRIAGSLDAGDWISVRWGRTLLTGRGDGVGGERGSGRWWRSSRGAKEGSCSLPPGLGGPWMTGGAPGDGGALPRPAAVPAVPLGLILEHMF